MALSKLNDSKFDYTFTYQTGFVKHKALQATRMLSENSKFQGSIPVSVYVSSLVIPFQVSPAGILALRKAKFKVKNLKAVGLSNLKDLDKHMSSLLDNKPKVSI